LVIFKGMKKPKTLPSLKWLFIILYNRIFPINIQDRSYSQKIDVTPG
jgi:hypothetical protein